MVSERTRLVNVYSSVGNHRKPFLGFDENSQLALLFRFAKANSPLNSSFKISNEEQEDDFLISFSGNKTYEDSEQFSTLTALTDSMSKLYLVAPFNESNSLSCTMYDQLAEETSINAEFFNPPLDQSTLVLNRGNLGVSSLARELISPSTTSSGISNYKLGFRISISPLLHRQDKIFFSSQLVSDLEKSLENSLTPDLLVGLLEENSSKPYSLVTLPEFLQG